MGEKVCFIPLYRALSPLWPGRHGRIDGGRDTAKDQGAVHGKAGAVPLSSALSFTLFRFQSTGAAARPQGGSSLLVNPGGNLSQTP